MNTIIVILVSLLSGITASLGLGGGFILLIYLTAFASMPQLQAQGINLIFFLPIAALSLYMHFKNKLIDKRPLIPAIITGIGGVLMGVFLANKISTELLAKIFAIFVLLLGIKEVFHKKK